MSDAKQSVVAILCVVAFEPALWTGTALATEDAHDPPMTIGTQATVPLPHSREEETATIRKHHLKRLDDKLTIDARVLHEHCRYESEISTRPPAKHVVLTFDDGPEPGQTELILGVLERHRIDATFFLVGRKAEQHPELVEQIRRAGHHMIGNHSWDHPNFHDIAVARQTDEIVRTEALWPTNPPRLFRYPYGNSSCEANEFLHSQGYRIVGWHVDSCDWAFDRTGEIDAKEALACGVLPQNRKDFVEHVLSTVRGHNGGIVLLHEIHPNTIKKLDEIISKLLDSGFVFHTLDDDEFLSSLR